MQSIIAGYRRFRDEIYPAQKSHFKLLADSQHPHTLFITCSDSRVVPDMITQTEPGELFICRVVGNLVPAYGSAAGGVMSAVEYAVSVLKVKHVIICGHSDCGAMRAFANPEKLSALPAVEAWLQHASSAVSVSKQMHKGLPEDEFLVKLIQENIVSQLQHLRTHPSVALGLRDKSLSIHGWYYQIGDGLVTTYDEAANGFAPLDAGWDESATPEAVRSSMSLA